MLPYICLVEFHIANNAIMSLFWIAKKHEKVYTYISCATFLNKREAVASQLSFVDREALFQGDVDYEGLLEIINFEDCTFTRSI